jgi:hypothetical protein
MRKSENMTQLVKHGPPPQQLCFIGRSRYRTESFSRDCDRPMKQSFWGGGQMCRKKMLTFLGYRFTVTLVIPVR